LLERNDLKGLGGVLMDDVEEAVPKCARVIQVSYHRVHFFKVFFLRKIRKLIFFPKYG
jgi:hypothetical protein